MLTVLASLAFVAAALAALAAMRATFAQYRDIAFGNIAALSGVSDQREFRVTMVAHGRKPVLAGHPGIRRIPVRAQAARGGLRPSQPRRAAA